jgi:hypothetical protein
MSVMYMIKLAACDDTTELHMALTDTEADTVRRIAAASVAASEHSCQPVLMVTASRHLTGQDEED